jgi:hypothetical protein
LLSFLPLTSHSDSHDACLPACLPAGPFFLTFAGPAEAFPDLTDTSKLRLVAQGVRDTLNLGSTYPLENILVWIQAGKDVTTGPMPTRHLLAPGQLRVLVIGYSIVITSDLPPVEELKARMDAPEVTQQFAEKLADANFVTQEQLGMLSIWVASVASPEQVVQQVTVMLQAPGGPTEAVQFVPIGECLRLTALLLLCATWHVPTVSQRPKFGTCRCLPDSQLMNWVLQQAAFELISHEVSTS